MNKYENSVGVLIPEILLPKEGTDMTKWAVVACDQFTSQPDYWQETESIVGDAPSTLRLMLPEMYLEKPDEAERIEKINATMKSYLDTGVLAGAMVDPIDKKLGNRAQLFARGIA